MNDFLQGLVNFFLSPITWFFSSMAVVVPFIVGAFKDPSGAANTFICKLIDVVVSPLPSTPENMKVGNLINSIGDNIPLFGRSVVADIFQTGAAMFAIIVLIKLYKLIPFKAT